jgi:hypothetical protein
MAYASLPLADAATLLFFTEMKDLMAFAAEVSSVFALGKGADVECAATGLDSEPNEPDDQLRQHETQVERQEPAGQGGRHFEHASVRFAAAADCLGRIMQSGRAVVLLNFFVCVPPTR